MISQIRQLHVRNYKSIGEVTVALEPLTVFVGPNGSGKSNIIDALAFVQESLTTTVELAFKNRGGIGAVRRRSGGHPTHIGIHLVLELQDGSSAEYEFTIAAKPKERFRVAQERCCVRKLGEKDQVFELRNGEFRSKIPGVRARVAFDRLGFSAACVRDEFRLVYDFLSQAHFYSIVPDRLRQLQEPDSGEFLKPDGSNAAAVLKRLREEEQGTERYVRLCQILSKIVPGLQKVEYRSVGQKETLRFRQDIELKRTCPFDALNMSDGTLRILGLLLAVYQVDGPSLIAIEEPGGIVYPASAEIVMRVLTEAAGQRQVLITTHSPDILNYPDLTDAQIRPVTMLHGSTIVGHISPQGRDAMRTQLLTAGELLRSNKLEPASQEEEQSAEQMDLFQGST